MCRALVRAAASRSASVSVFRRGPVVVNSGSRSFASTRVFPADKPRSWKNVALRWTLALGAVYCYNTSPVFADEPPESRFIVSRSPSFAEADLPTVEAVIEEKRQQLRAPTEEPSRQRHGAAASSTEQTSLELQDSTPGDGSPQSLEEAGQEGAFNPETGEIHWDCPCLGGMAHGPCGEQFKAAFSCFVYSTEEPKGMDCIDKFQTMQDCFRQYPDVYGAELADDDKPPENETTEQAASQQTVESVQEARQPLTTAEHSEFEKAAEPAPTANHHQAQATPERQTETVSHARVLGGHAGCKRGPQESRGQTCLHGGRDGGLKKVEDNKTSPR